MIRSEPLAMHDLPLADRQSMNVFIDVWNEQGGNISLAKAESLTVVDPVAEEAFARSRAYGELLDASLVRTDDMLARAECCGVARVFCVCIGDEQ
jgi:hypothetical protein